MTTFYDFGINHQIVRAITEMGFEEATPIQEQTIPTLLAGKDVIGQAQTGTGKTAAFGIPLIEKVDVDAGTIQGLVLAPTRELAVQVAEELNKIGNLRGVHALPIYGGQDIGRQIKALKRKPQIIVATPGRFMDHMRRKTIRMNTIEMVILDEADEMLNMGFIEDIETILKEVPNERQTLLFSATMPKQIRSLAEKFMKPDAEAIVVKSVEITTANVEQEYMEVPESKKFDVLCRMLDIHSPTLAIVFGRTKRRVDEVSEALNKRGYGAEGLHGDINQNQRDRVIKKFKEGTVEVLVATDVAARGLDITGVTHVYNFDIPQDPESYVHRIGRTGRAGNKGLAVTFVTPRELPHLKTIEKTSNRKITRKAVPTLAEAMEGQLRMTVDSLLKTVEENDFQSYRMSAEQLLEETDSVSLLSAALKMLTKEPNDVPVKLTEEAPLRIKGFKSGGGRGKGKGKGGFGRGNKDRDRKGGPKGGQSKNSKVRVASSRKKKKA